MTGAPGAGGAPGPAAGPVTGGMTGPDLSSWTFWWGFNKERYLNLKTRIAKIDGVITPGSADDIISGKASGRDTMRPSKEQIATRVVPALKEALEKETNKDIVTGALVALAKIGEEPLETQKIFQKFLTSDTLEVSETAALSYGILASPEGIPTLLSLFKDTDDGRKLVGGKKEVPWRTRTFAAYGLGLIGARTSDPEVRAKIQQFLLDFMKDEGLKRASQKDLRVAVVVSLGLMPDPDRKAVTTLQQYFAENRKKEEIICAHVPNAIARLLREAPVNERQQYAEQMAMELGERKGTETFLRPSFPQAIGLLTRHDDPHVKKCVEAIQDKIEKEVSKIPQVAYFGMMALGQISGTGDPGTDIEKYLVERAKQKGGRVMSRAWAALALGVAGYDQQEKKNLPPNENVGTVLLEMMRDIKDPEQLSAYAIGLGLMRYTAAKSQLLKCLEDVKSDEYRGYFAVGLGLMNEKDTTSTIQAIVKGSTRRPELLRETSIALGLLGDKSIVPVLVEILKDKENKTLAVQAAVATALGYVGDYRTIDPLVALLRDEKHELTAESRAFAAAALGIVGDKEDFTWNAKIAADINYVATTQTLNDHANATGILNLL